MLAWWKLGTVLGSGKITIDYRMSVDLPDVDRLMTEGSRCINFLLSLLLGTASLPEDFSGDRLLDPPLPDAFSRREGDSEGNAKGDPPCSNP